MPVLIIVGVVADVARANGVRSTYPFIAKVLSPPNFIDKLGTHRAFQLVHNLLTTLHSSFTVQPSNGLALAIEIALPLHEGVVSHALFAISCLSLCVL